MKKIHVYPYIFAYFWISLTSLNFCMSLHCKKKLSYLPSVTSLPLFLFLLLKSSTIIDGPYGFLEKYYVDSQSCFQASCRAFAHPSTTGYILYILLCFYSGCLMCFQLHNNFHFSFSCQEPIFMLNTLFRKYCPGMRIISMEASIQPYFWISLTLGTTMIHFLPLLKKCFQ